MMTETDTFLPLASCHCCGLIQHIPAHTAKEKPVCARCATPLPRQQNARNQWTIIFSLTALIFYLPALFLPLLRIEQLGHRHEDSLFMGLITLLGQGYWFVGGIVLLFSVLLPPLKLLSLLILSSTNVIHHAHHRALTYRAVELLGRWGMLDVMLVAILVAFVKLGGLVSISAGTGLLAFTLLVLCSLFASLSFNPHVLWDIPNE
ncbi:paraquat-inducible protein A [Beggiatoa leptomitoformis]|nr:paraquat-inducible protein A [Beggiatoa leptomitoformis]